MHACMYNYITIHAIQGSIRMPGKRLLRGMAIQWSDNDASWTKRYTHATGQSGNPAKNQAKSNIWFKLLILWWQRIASLYPGTPTPQTPPSATVVRSKSQASCFLTMFCKMYASGSKKKAQFTRWTSWKTQGGEWNTRDPSIKRPFDFPHPGPSCVVH